MIDLSSFGVPHHRERLITIGCRIPEISNSVSLEEGIYSKELSLFHAKPSHGRNCKNKLVSLRQAIGHLLLLILKKGWRINLIYSILYQNGIADSIFG